jgi:hypothetical protein
MYGRLTNREIAIANAGSARPQVLFVRKCSGVRKWIVARRQKADVKNVPNLK